MRDCRPEDYEEAKWRWPNRDEEWWRFAADCIVRPIPLAKPADIVELTLGDPKRKWRTRGPFDLNGPTQDEGVEGLRRAVAWAAREARAKRRRQRLVPDLSREGGKSR